MKAAGKVACLTAILGVSAAARDATLATLADLQALIGHAEKMAGRLAERMRSGEIAPRPLCGKDGKGPCENCDYAAICRADASQKQGNAQVMQDMDLDELLARINP